MKAVLLDAGLTLLRAEPSLGGVYAGVTRRLGVEVPPAAFERAAEAAFHLMGLEHREGGEPGLRTSDDLERESWRRHARRVMDGVPAMAGLDFGRWFEALYDEFGAARAWVPFDDARPALEALRRAGVRTAVVSNWDGRLRGILEEHRLTPLLDAVVISAEVGWRKPHGAVFERALEALGVRPAEALHCGDSLGDDVEGARAAGIRPVLLSRGVPGDSSGRQSGDPTPGRRAPDGVAVVRDLVSLADLAI